MKILILGATGLLGNTMFAVISERADWKVSATLRNRDAAGLFTAEAASNLVSCDNLGNLDELSAMLEQVSPDLVINCLSVPRESMKNGDAMKFISNYALLPQRLLRLCRGIGARLIQISSDGVFSGKRGGYVESDIPDADDIYGICKLLGEVDGANTITIRCSMIGHELKTKSGLLEWFLAQQEQCKCFTRAIFSGLPTVVLARIIRDIVIPAEQLCGLYHVAAQPISKFELLSLVASRYNKEIQIVPDDSVVINRSLNADKFTGDTGYIAPEWPDLIDAMYAYRFGSEVK